MKAQNLTPRHIGQSFKLTHPAGDISGGLSDYEHRTTPKGAHLSTVVWIRGLQVKLTPRTPLTFIPKATT